jgi:hypothetical protein
LSITALIEDHTDQVETVMQWPSRSSAARRIDREMGKGRVPAARQRNSSYLRYSVLPLSY